MDIFHSSYYRINKCLLLYAGFWPYQQRTIKRLTLSFTIFTGIIFVVPQIFYIVKYLHNLDKVLISLPPATGSILILAKMLILASKGSEMRCIVDEICEDWNIYSTDREQQILMKYACAGRMCTLGYGLVAGSALVLIGISSFSEAFFDIILPLNESRPRNLPHPAEYFVDQNRYFYLLVLSEDVGYLVLGIFIIGCDTMFVITVQHCCGLFTILRYNLENMPIQAVNLNTESEFVEAMHRELLSCIHLHLKIKRYVQLMTSIFETLNSVDIIFGATLHCVASVMVCICSATAGCNLIVIGNALRGQRYFEQIVVFMDNPTYVMKFGAVIIAESVRLFLNNWPGQNLMDHSASVSTSAYCGTWYRMSNKTKRLLLFLIMDAQKPHVLTVAKLYPMDLHSFGMVMRTSLSYCTVMASLHNTSAE